MRAKNIFWLLGLLLLGACGWKKLQSKGAKLDPVPELDLERYQGKWFQIAAIPNWFERKCDRDATADYWLNEDGTVSVINQCVRKDGGLETAEAVAKVNPQYMLNSVLEVKFGGCPVSCLPFLKGNYWVIELDPDYQWAVVGEPSRKYLWILCRQPHMDEITYTLLLDRIADHGYDISKIVRSTNGERASA